MAFEKQLADVKKSSEKEIHMLEGVVEYLELEKKQLLKELAEMGQKVQKLEELIRRIEEGLSMKATQEYGEPEKKKQRME